MCLIQHKSDLKPVCCSQLTPSSPHRKLRNAIISAIAPTASENTKLALKNKGQKRKRISQSSGMVLTDADVMNSLQPRLKETKLEHVHQELKERIESMGMDYVDCPSDGNCFFHALAIGLNGEYSHEKLRQMAVEELQRRPTHVSL